MMRTLGLPCLFAMALIMTLISVALSYQRCDNVPTLDSRMICYDASSDSTEQSKSGLRPSLFRRAGTVRKAVHKVTSFFQRPFQSRPPTPRLDPHHSQTTGTIVNLKREGELHTAPVFIGKRRQKLVHTIVNTGRTDTFIVNGETSTSVTLSLPHLYGKPLEDNVDLLGLSAQQRFWSKPKQLSLELGQGHVSNVEGILSMSPQNSSASLRGYSFPRNVPIHVFALLLSYSSPQLHLRWINSAIYVGEIEYHNVVEQTDLWMIKDGHLIVNGKNILSGFVATIDSGTPFIYGSMEDVAKIYQYLGGEMIQGRHYFPCDRVRSVSFSWGNGEQWHIAEDIFKYSRFTRRRSNRSESMCFGAIQFHRGLGKGQWRMGTLFLRNVYTVFDVEHQRVGFGRLRVGMGH